MVDESQNTVPQGNMLLDSLEDNKEYLKSTLLACLAEIKDHNGRKLPSKYLNVLRREKEGVEVYQCRRDPTTNYRFYTGRQVRKIIEYELRRRAGTL